MTRAHGLKVLLFVCACMLPVVASCKATPFKVELTPGFRGTVTVTCDSTGSAFRSVTADARGNAEAPVCPVSPTDIVVMRDGKKIATEGSLSWMTTGDGIPVGLRFQVR
jgi:hypothetical protein